MHINTTSPVRFWGPPDSDTHNCISTMYTGLMTNTIDKRKLTSVLEDRIAAMHPTNMTGAKALGQVLRDINNGTYDTQTTAVVAELTKELDIDRDTEAKQQDPLEAHADRIESEQAPLDAIRDIPIGDVAYVLDILDRRGVEYAKRAATLRDRRVTAAKAAEDLLRRHIAADADVDQFDEARIERDEDRFRRQFPSGGVIQPSREA